jgi:hypothetical protein
MSLMHILWGFVCVALAQGMCLLGWLSNGAWGGGCK